MKSSMKRRIFATALSLIMAAGLFFGTGIPARADENTLTISTNLDCKVIAVSPAEGIDGNLYYYDLTANVALTSNPDSIKIKELDGHYDAATYNMDLDGKGYEEVLGDNPLAIGPEFEFKTSYFTDDYSFKFEDGYDPASFDYSNCMGYYITFTDGSKNSYCVIVKCFPFPLPVKPETVELNFGSYSWDTDITDASGAWTFDSVNKILTINEGHTVTVRGTAPSYQIEKVSVKGTLAGDAVFNLRDAVENNGGTISGGIFECPVKNNGGTINGGIFRRAQNSRSHIYNYSGTISDGTFDDVAAITNYDTISGGTFNAYVENINDDAVISGGIFSENVSNEYGGTIKGGTFNNVYNDDESVISVDAGGKLTIKGSITNEGTIANNSGGKIIVESGGNIDNKGGTITNDGSVILPTDIDAKNLGMTGTGTIEQGDKKYKNDGTEIKPTVPIPTPGPGNYYPTQNLPTNTSPNISVSGDSSIKVSASVNGNKVTVGDITTETLNTIVKSDSNDKNKTDITIDLSTLNNIKSVVLTKASLDNISKVLNDSSNNKTGLEIRLKDVTERFDTGAILAITSQTEGKDLSFNISKTGDIISLSIVSNGKEISDFNDGIVTIGINNFSVGAGKKAENYYAYYKPKIGEPVRMPTWVKNGVLFFTTGHFSDYEIVYDESIKNGETKPVYRVYNTRNGDHLFTTNEAEKNACEKNGWSYEGISFYVLPDSEKKVYRLFNPRTGEHFLTANESEKDACVKSGWILEGVAFAGEGEQVIYRLFNPSPGGMHMYVTTEKARDYLVSLGWKYEGIGYNAN